MTPTELPRGEAKSTAKIMAAGTKVRIRRPSIDHRLDVHSSPPTSAAAPLQVRRRGSDISPAPASTAALLVLRFSHHRTTPHVTSDPIGRPTPRLGEHDKRELNRPGDLS